MNILDQGSAAFYTLRANFLKKTCLWAELFKTSLLQAAVNKKKISNQNKSAV